MRIKILLFTLLISTGLKAQFNLDSVSHVNLPSLHSSFLNDIWGYADGQGAEYALVGMQDGTSIVDVSVPQNPQEVFWGPGMNSTWRDIKTWDHYAYVTTEAANGLYIIDLQNLPASNLATSLYYGPGWDQWHSAHNLYIDSSGYAYIFGADRGNGGVIILDLNQDPMNPVEVGTFDNWYVHDGYVLGDTMYLAHIYEGIISVVDVSDKANPVLLGTKTTPSDFAHNVWARADGQVVFTTDEISGAYVAAYNVSDPTNIVELDRVQSSPGAGVIPHNTHVLGNYLVTSYYSDGVTVHDATHPYNLIEVGRYDTYPGQTISYDGCWGTYPFLPSGLVLASDITEGLFILNPTYQQASYLEGTVTDVSTTNPLSGVEVNLNGQVMTEITNTIGFYATGLADPQTADVTFSKVGYYPQTVSVNLSAGVITTLNIQLVPIPPFNLDVHVEDASGNALSGVQIKLVHPLIIHSGSTNGLGDDSFSLFYEDNHTVTVGKWSFKTSCDQVMIDENTASITVVLEEGYYDDFEFDFGWTETSTATSGIWEREIPVTGNLVSPLIDADYDCGKFAYITGNTQTFNSDLDDVDNGETRITSPVFDLSTYSDPHVNFAYWFYNFHGPMDVDDTLRVIINNGINTEEIFKTGSLGDTAYWDFVSLRVEDFILPTATMTLQVFVSDLDPNVNITEAAFDFFTVSEYNAVGITETELSLRLYPNPVSDRLFLEGAIAGSNYTLINSEGKILLEGRIPDNNELNLSDITSGFYLLNVDGKSYRIIKN